MTNLKNTSLLLCGLLFGVAYNGLAQTTAPATTAMATSAASADFYAGKWEIAIVGTPMGDVKLLADLVRKDGKLTGELTNTADPSSPKLPITKLEESADKLVIFFDSSQAGELSIDLKKVDDDTLKGALMNFDSTAKRVK
jgi:hypothetical protein